MVTSDEQWLTVIQIKMKKMHVNMVIAKVLI